MNSILYETANTLVNTFNATTVYSTSLLVLFYLVYIQFKRHRIDMVIVAAVFSIVPALTPLLTELSGLRYFTMLNYDLQQDETLKAAGVILISIFTVSILIGERLTLSNLPSIGRQKLVFPIWFLVFVFALNLFLILRFLEAGTVLFQSYGSLKTTETHYSSLVNQFLNASVSVFLSYHIAGARKRFNITFLLVFIVISLLVSRRTLAIGLLLILMFQLHGSQLRVRDYVLGFIVLFLLWFIGEVRNLGIINSFSAASFAASPKVMFALPGGASNVFVGTMGVIDLNNHGALNFAKAFPLSQWLTGRYEPQIYESFGYDYNGGMHLANITYWNFGLVGTIVFGMIIGMIYRTTQKTMEHMQYSTGGTLGTMLAFSAVLLVPNLMWYHPIGLIKLIITITIFYLLMTFLADLQKR